MLDRLPVRSLDDIPLGIRVEDKAMARLTSHIDHQLIHDVPAHLVLDHQLRSLALSLYDVALGEADHKNRTLPTWGQYILDFLVTRKEADRG